jgi:hypothetical protein
VLTDVVEGGCHRKFEPGFLGSNSTLCVTGLLMLLLRRGCGVFVL